MTYALISYILYVVLRCLIHVAIICFGIVLVHEGGHVLAGLCVNLKPKKIKITVYGIGIQHLLLPSTTRWDKIIVLSGGILANLIICVLLWYIWPEFSHMNGFFALLTAVPFRKSDTNQIYKFYKEK